MNSSGQNENLIELSFLNPQYIRSGAMGQKLHVKLILLPRPQTNETGGFPCNQIHYPNPTLEGLVPVFYG